MHTPPPTTTTTTTIVSTNNHNTQTSASSPHIIATSTEQQQTPPTTNYSPFPSSKNCQRTPTNFWPKPPPPPSKTDNLGLLTCSRMANYPCNGSCRWNSYIKNKAYIHKTIYREMRGGSWWCLLEEEEGAGQWSVSVVSLSVLPTEERRERMWK